MSTYKKYQASSLWIDITCENTALIDTSVNAWSNNWAGFWNIVDSDGTVKLTGSLTKSATVGVFQLRIGPASVLGWSTLTPGTYTLSYQFRNTVVDYDQEENDKLTILAQKYV